MVHQHAQNVDGDSGVGVTLSVAVQVGVKHDAGLVVLDAVGGAQRRHPGHPGAVVEREAERGDGAPPVGVAPIGGQQLEAADGVWG